MRQKRDPLAMRTTAKLGDEMRALAIEGTQAEK